MASANARRVKRRRAGSGRGAIELLGMIAAVAALIFLAVFGARYFANRTPSQDVFCEGVYVNGVSMGGLSWDEGYQLIRDKVDERLNRDTYTLKYANQKWEFVPAQFSAKLNLDEELQLAWNFGHTGSAAEKRQQADYVRQNPIQYDSSIEFDEVLLEEYILSIKRQIDVDPVEASVIVGADEVLTVTESQNGLSLNTSKVVQVLEDAILRGTTLEVELQPDVKEPNYTSEELKANTQLIASYSTKTTGSSSKRNKNIARALGRFNGFTLYPETPTSFNDTVGKRTEANGFVESPEYDGNTVISGIGGGTCQASTTLYGALLLANVDIDVRNPHTMTVAYVKASLDAAVSDRGKDLVFTNHEEYPMYIYTSVDGARAQVNIYGPPCAYDIVLDSQITDVIKPKGSKNVADNSGKYVYYLDDEPVLKSEGRDGRKSKAYRVYYDKTTGVEVERQLLSSDSYMSSKPEYWVGVHSYDGENTAG